jgi:hypothetical protein
MIDTRVRNRSLAACAIFWALVFSCGAFVHLQSSALFAFAIVYILGIAGFVRRCLRVTRGYDYVAIVALALPVLTVFGPFWIVGCAIGMCAQLYLVWKFPTT